MKLNEMKNALILGSLFLFCAAALVQAQWKTCYFCGKTFKGDGYSHDIEVFCSKKCLEKRYSCASCGAPFSLSQRSKFTPIENLQGETDYFCESCMKKPGCEYCESRKGTTQVNGMTLCVDCRESMISTTEEAVPILKEAQEMLAKEFHFPINPALKMEVVSKEEYKRRGGPENGVALFIRNESITSKFSPDLKVLTIELGECEMDMLVTAAPRAVVFKYIVHELTHEFLYRHDYYIEDELINEGFCEAIAGSCCNLKRYLKLTQRMHFNEAPIYGDGFRKMYAMLQEKGLEETLVFIRSHSLTREQYILTNIPKSQADFIKQNNLKPQIVIKKAPNAGK